MSSILIAALPEDQTAAERLLETLSGTYRSLGFVPDNPSTAQEAVDESQLLLVLVSQEWASRVETDAPVYNAVQRGLDHPELPVLVILLDDASLPGVTEMPPDLRALTYMSTAELHTDERFRQDVTALAHQMASYLTQTADADVVEELIPSADTQQRRRRIPFNLLMIALIFAFAVFLLLRPVPDSGIPELPDIVFGRTAGSETSGDGPVTADVDVLLGVAASFSGGTTTRGQEILNGVQLAVQEREQVVVDGRRYAIDLLTQDTGCSAVGGERVAELFAASPNLMAVVGHMCNASCSAAVPIYENAGLAAVSPACTEPDLTRASRLSFARVVPSEAAAATAAAEYVYESLAQQEVAVIHDEQRFGMQFADAFTARYESLGGVIGTRYGTETGTISYDAIAETVIANESSSVYFAGRPSNAAGIRQALQAAGAGDVPFVAAMGGDVDAFIDAAGDAANGTYFVQLTSPERDALASLRERYQGAYAEAPTTTAYAYAYDATNLLLDTIEATAESGESSVSVDPAALQEAIRNYSGEGVTGPLDCTPDGECARADAEVSVVEAGTLSAVDGS